MAGEVSKLWVFLGLKSELAKNMANEIRQVQKEFRNFDTISKALTDTGRTLTTSVTLPLVAIGGAAAKVAMDAVESENLFTVSMGNMADSARTWSEDLRKQLGLNAYEIRKNVGTFNVMFGSMGVGEQAAYDMSKGLTQLSYDMASFYNLDPTEAFEKLQAGISGEAEPLKRLGILVNETMVKTYAYTHGIAEQGAVLTEQQKVMARYGVIMEATSKAQGDLARTADSPANVLKRLGQQVKNVGIDLGMALMPAIQTILPHIANFVTWIGNLVQKFSDLPPGLQTVILGILGVAAAIGPLLLGFGQVMKTVKAAATIFHIFTKHPILLAIAAISAVVIILIKHWDDIKAAAQKAWQAIVDFIQPVIDKVQAIIDKVKAAIGWLGRLFGAGEAGAPAAAAGAGVEAMAGGGIITEPIWGVGASGRRYLFGESGAERVTPIGSGGTSLQVDYGRLADAIVLALREYPQVVNNNFPGGSGLRTDRLAYIGG